MKKSKFSDEQITFALKQADTGTRVEEVCRKMGISQATFYNWKKKCGGLGIPELRWLKQLEEENRRLKGLVADLSLDKEMLQEGGAKKTVKPAVKRDAVGWMMNTYQVSTRRAARLMQMTRSTYYYRPHPRDDRAERARIREIAETRVRYGMWRIHVPMRREGWMINPKKTHRIYCDEGLHLRRRWPRRRVAAMHRESRAAVSRINEA